MSVRQLYATFFGGLVLAILVLAAFTSWYTVDETEQVALHTFGKVTQTHAEPGLHFKLPWPIQTVTKVSKETFSFDFGTNDGGRTMNSDAKMITGDENILLADLVVQWRISDVRDFLYATQDPEKILASSTSAALRGVIGSTKIDDALTVGKPEIERRVKEQLISLMDDYNAGIQIIDVKLKTVDLPTEEVRKAFTEVTDAREMMNTKINQANKYYNEKYNYATGEKDAIISKAQGDKTARIEGAKGDVAKFNAIYSEYVKNPSITKQRLVLETLEAILPGAQIYIMDDTDGVVKYLPLDRLPGGSQAAGAKQGTAEEGGTK
ncbi:FtsH protease activity modulator HflK [Rubeoparvulum massiliense]|uniref:FtsH protease activity modulator HflK n=1 Tax=Rubeoparvulum massiliense TaxID=1631346 RepID=UPI00065DD414|nr:FtsH protease activity modulator HflK [Rubeoparvulum massiliense]